MVDEVKRRNSAGRQSPFYFMLITTLFTHFDVIPPVSCSICLSMILPGQKFHERKIPHDSAILRNPYLRYDNSEPGYMLQTEGALYPYPTPRTCQHLC